MSESNNHKLPKSDAEEVPVGLPDNYNTPYRASYSATPQATDKGCCDRCHCNKDCILQGAENCCHNGNCPCHKDSTPSLSEGEGWEKDFDERYRNLLIVLGISEEKKVAGITQSIWAKDFIRSLLSQTLSNERQRMVAIGNSLRDEIRSRYRGGDGDMSDDFYDGEEAAIATYQQKIKSLNS